MPRLTGVSDREAGLSSRIAFFFARRKLKQLAGTDASALLDPLRMYAYLPKVLNAYGRLEQAQSTLQQVLSPRHRALAELKAATTVRCEYCIDLGSQIARRWGITDARTPRPGRLPERDVLLRRRQTGPGLRHGDQPHPGVSQ